MDHDGFIDNLLELRVFEIVSHHGFEDAEKLSVGYVTVFVDVVDPRAKGRELDCSNDSQGLFVQNLRF